MNLKPILRDNLEKDSNLRLPIFKDEVKNKNFKINKNSARGIESRVFALHTASLGSTPNTPSYRK